MDFSTLSDDELKAMYSQRQQPQQPDYSQMSDEELINTYSQRQKPQPPSPYNIQAGQSINLPSNIESYEGANSDANLQPLFPAAKYDMKAMKSERQKLGLRTTSKDYKNYQKQFEQGISNVDYFNNLSKPQQPLMLEGGVHHIGTGDEPREIGGFEKFAYGALPIAGGIAGSIAGLPAGPAGIIAGGAGGAATGELWKRNLEALRGVRPIEENDAVKTLMGAGQAGVEDALWTGGLMGVGRGVQAGVKAAAPTFNKLVSVIPEQETQRLMSMIENKSDAFKGTVKEQLENLGKTLRTQRENLLAPEQSLLQLPAEAKRVKNNLLVPENKIKQSYFGIAKQADDVLKAELGKLGSAARQQQELLKGNKYFADMNDLTVRLADRIKQEMYRGESRIPKGDMAEAKRIIFGLRDLYNRQGVPTENLVRIGKGDQPFQIDLALLNQYKTRISAENSDLYKQGKIGDSGSKLIKDLIGIIREVEYKYAPDPELFLKNEAFSNFKKEVAEPVKKAMMGKSRDNLFKQFAAGTLPPEQMQAISKLNEVSGGKLLAGVKNIQGIESKNNIIKNLIKDADIRNPLNILNKTIDEQEAVKQYAPELYEKALALQANKQQKEALAKTIKDTDIKNPLNVLNKTTDELEAIKQLNPNVYEQLMDLRTRTVFDRPFSFSRNPYMTDRIQQEEVIQQMQLLRMLGGGVAGFTGGGIPGAAIGSIGATIAGSPRLQKGALELMLTPRPLAAPIAGSLGAGTPANFDENALSELLLNIGK